MPDAYVVRGLTLRQVAAEAGCGLRTVARWMEKHGIQTRSGDALHRRRWRGGTCRECRDRSGEANSNWRGDAIRNPQAHDRLKKLRGSARDHPCTHCGGPAAEWAYDHQDPDELPDPEGPYSLKPEHYMPLCKSCHRKFDSAR